MRILIVGATGTIGRAVVAALSAGNEIVPMDVSGVTATRKIIDAVSRAADNGIRDVDRGRPA